jgi:divalent metal cation (Fe/Co/Zn/Cd) transporter
MLAEPTHSIADTGNEVLLYVGVRHGRRPADDQHPFGYGQARYFWSLVAAVGIFVVGGLSAIADGIQTLRHPVPSPTCRWAWPCCWFRSGWRACRGAPGADS